MAEPVALWVKLTFLLEKRGEFEAYERAAAAILADYGGSITLTFRPEAEPDVEWHVVTFPDAAAFAAYRQDERVAGLTAIQHQPITPVVAVRNVNPNINRQANTQMRATRRWSTSLRV